MSYRFRIIKTVETTVNTNQYADPHTFVATIVPVYADGSTGQPIDIPQYPGWFLEDLAVNWDQQPIGVEFLLDVTFLPPGTVPCSASG